jgi:hypothetical protein
VRPRRGLFESSQFEGPVIVAMVAVLAMKPPVDEIIDMVAVRYRLVPAIRAMDMAIVALGCLSLGATVRVRIVNCDPVLVDMAVVRVVEMTVVQIVGMPVMANSDMAAIGPVLMGMVPMRLMLHRMLCRHSLSPSCSFNQRERGRSVPDRSERQGRTNVSIGPIARG